ncbi:MAG: hypothetical protein JRG96_10270 [Deltaproteobacteria bacterium]|nr:hypothetical protein [Deltaproteobacteria bacterium]MBW2416911.1 hypothetical protein [Deltaproteobacteria bacterium]
MDTAQLLSLTGAALSLGGWALWYQRIQQVRVPKEPWAFRLASGLGALLCVAGLLGGPGWAAGTLAVIGLAAGGGFLALDRIAPLPAVVPAVTVGGPAPDFEATGSDDAPFRLREPGRGALLLKFFRGFW